MKRNNTGLTDSEFKKWLLLQDECGYFVETDGGGADGWSAQVGDRRGRVIASATDTRRDRAVFSAIRAAIALYGGTPDDN